MYKKEYTYLAFHKPYGVLCQFTKEVESHTTLADYITTDKDVYPVGRLDKDSEGLLILTNDNQLKNKLLSPQKHSKKTYWVQVDGAITDDSLAQLAAGVTITVNKKKHSTLPATVARIETPSIEDRNPPVRYRASIPTSWVSITISEGKNRQVRRMCAAVGYPVLRLIRTQINNYTLESLPLGEWVRLDEDKVRLLGK